MGGISSSFVDCVQDCDTQRLKQQLLARVADVEEDELTMEELHNEVEDAIHAAVSMEVTTPHQYQQLQIALEMLLHVAPSALQSFECNNSQWTALHRACVTGNLSFVAFLFHRYADQIQMQRDAYGLLPVDLVPPELSTIAAADVVGEDLSPMSIKALPSTDRERIVLALRMLRRSKDAAQRHALSAYLPEKQAPVSEGNQVEGHDSEPVVDPKTVQPEYFISFEPSRENLSPDRLGCVHQLQSPLRLRYRFPNKDPFLHGYFQLIWRAGDEPRSEEPHYEHHLLLRDCLDLDHEPPQSHDLESNQRETRRLHDHDQVSGEPSSSNHGLLTGCVPVDVSHLAEDTVCHVLFVASDKHLMKREIVMSTEGVRLMQTDSLDAMGHRVQVEEPYEEAPYEFDIDSDGEIDGYVFHVAGEAFTHPSEQLAGRSFETLEEFESFVKLLRTTKQVDTTEAGPVVSASGGDAENKAAAEARLPTVSSNQEEEDTAEAFVHVDIKQVETKPSNQDECEREN